MAKFTLAISTDNAAFDDSAFSEIASILQDLATSFEDGQTEKSGELYDLNGNPVGKWKMGGK